MANLRLHLTGDELQAIESRRRELNRNGRRRLSRSDVLRRVIRVGLGLDAQMVPWPDIPDDAVVRATQKVAAVHDAYVAPHRQDEIARAARLRDLFERCQRRWDAGGVTPLQFAASVERVAPGLERDLLFEWYYSGAVPEDVERRDAVLRAIETYLNNISERP